MFISLLLFVFRIVCLPLCVLCGHLYKVMRVYNTYKVDMYNRQCMAMQGKLVVFRVYKNTKDGVKTSPTFINRFVQKFYGQDTTSHKGKYRFHRRGLMEDIAHIKLIRGVIIVKVSDLEKVLNFLNAYNAEVYIRDVTLTPEDEKNLNKENT